MTHRRHNQLTYVGFVLAYLGAMLAMVVGEADRFGPVRWPVLWFLCGPMGVVGVLLLLAANLGRLDDVPISRCRPRDGRGNHR